VAGIIFFLLYRIFFNSLLSTGTVVGGLFMVLSLFWFIVPFVTGKDMSLPRFPDTVFQKGVDDLARIFLFMLGLFMFFVSLQA
jgi:prolipoprotein diacylglyceryltransferase